jgi:hypothetical protein
MANGEWPGSEEWAISRGVPIGTVANWAAEASRQIRQAIPDEVYLDQLRAWLERLGEQAERSKDFKAAIKAIEVMLGVRDRDVKRFEVARNQLARMDTAQQVAVVLRDPVLGPAVEHEVLKRRGLVVE